MHRHGAVLLMMFACCLLPPCSEKLLQDVYGYWAAKRKRWGKPILRRLQAPTIASDTNPYNTFRYGSTV